MVFIHDIVDCFEYLKIFQGNLPSLIKKLVPERNFVFQQNNPKPTFKIFKEWLFYTRPKQLHSLPQLLCLNTIEHFWEEVDRVRQQSVTTKETLKKSIELAWDQILHEKTKILSL